MSSIDCELAGVPLSNPILAASGTFGFGKPYADLYPLHKLGGIVTKGLTLTPGPAIPAHGSTRHHRAS